MRAVIQEDPAAFDGANAFRRCLIACPGMVAVHEAATGRPQTEIIHAVLQPMYFESCDLSQDSADMDISAIVRIGPAQTVYFLNCIMGDVAVPIAVGKGTFVINAPSAIVNLYMRQCILINGGQRLLVTITGGTADPAVNLDVDSCWIRGHNPAFMIDDFTDEAGWTLNADPFAVYSTDPEMINPPTNQEGIVNGQIHKKLKRFVLSAQNEGINHYRYSNNYGCYQYGDEIGGSAALALGMI